MGFPRISCSNFVALIQAPIECAVVRTVHCSLNLTQESRLLLMNNRTLDRVKALDGLRPAFSAHVRWCEHGAPVECAVARTVHCSLNLTQASRLLLMNKRTLDRPKSFDGASPGFLVRLRGVDTVHAPFFAERRTRGSVQHSVAGNPGRPAFSAHVRWCEHGAPIECAVARTVHCSLNLTQASRLLLMNNRTLDRPKALDGLRPAFSAHVSWCEHGAPIECAAAGTVHCSFNLPQASRLLGRTKGSALPLGTDYGIDSARLGRGVEKRFSRLKQRRKRARFASVPG
jgi:hypothetical protein